MDLTNWYTSVVGVVGVTAIGVTILKRLLGNVPYVNTLPTWCYAVLVSAGLVTLTNLVWHTLPGELWQNMLQASGFYEWYHNISKPLAAAAISAGVTVEAKNIPDRVDPQADLSTTKTLT
jgi:hypothetical protein